MTIMKKYILKLLLFSLPIILIICPSLLVLYMAGEIDGESDYVMPLQKNQLIGLAYTDIREAYKFKMTDSILQPEIIALGSSRIMQVKSDFISNDYHFYNAGGAVNNIYQYQLFLKELSYTPKLLIISIDQFLFNPNYQNQTAIFNPKCYEFPEHNLAYLLNSFIRDFYIGKIDFNKILQNKNRNIGLNAIINENGYKYDGTHQEKNLINNPLAEDYNFKDTFQRIAQGNRRFEYREHADTTMVGIIDLFLNECDKKGIAVVAIIPPFAPAVLQIMNDTGKYAYLYEIYDILIPCFNNHKHCYLYDYTDITAMNVYNYDFIDGFHGSEVIYCMLIRDILSQTPFLSKYFKDEKQLRKFEKEYNKRKIRYHSI